MVFTDRTRRGKLGRGSRLVPSLCQLLWPRSEQPDCDGEKDSKTSCNREQGLEAKLRHGSIFTVVVNSWHLVYITRLKQHKAKRRVYIAQGRAPRPYYSWAWLSQVASVASTSADVAQAQLAAGKTRPQIEAAKSAVQLTTVSCLQRTAFVTKDEPSFAPKVDSRIAAPVGETGNVGTVNRRNRPNPRVSFVSCVVAL